MSDRARSLPVAAYLLLAVLLGGSSQGLWTNVALQTLGILIIAWVAVARPAERLSSDSLIPALLMAFLLVVLVQVLPLPPEVWTDFPGREPIASAFQQIGFELPSMPLSLAPFDSVMAVFAAIPAIASFVATVGLRPLHSWIAVAVVAGTVLGTLLGALQVAAGTSSWTYLYEITNAGAVGFFANRNHMGTLLLLAIPMAAALIPARRDSRRSSARGRFAIAGAVLVLIVVGIVLNGSLAAIALSVPVLIASAALVPVINRWSRLALLVALFALPGAVALLAINPVPAGLTGAGATASVTTRTVIWTTTMEAINDSFPVGTGLGSFEQVYHQYEDHMVVTPQYVNHAHNDYLEVALELGAPGLLLLVMFLGWWIVSVSRIWSSPLSTRFARAATIATAAVLAHSTVDYPLRTASISSIFAALVGIMVHSRAGEGQSNAATSRATRHVKIK